MTSLASAPTTGRVCPPVVSGGRWPKLVSIPAEKACTGCGVVRPMEMFAKKRTARDGRMSRCKVCQSSAIKAHYRANVAYYVAKAAVYKREASVDLMDMVREELQKGCPTCGYVGPRRRRIKGEAPLGRGPSELAHLGFSRKTVLAKATDWRHQCPHCVDVPPDGSAPILPSWAG